MNVWFDSIKNCARSIDVRQRCIPKTMAPIYFRYVAGNMEDKKDSDETDAAIKRLGAFAILTSEEMSEDKLLPMYYTRQQVQELLKRRSKKAKSLNAESIFSYLRNQKCKVYGIDGNPVSIRKFLESLDSKDLTTGRVSQYV